MLSSLIAIAAAYLLGSVPFAVIVSRAFGLADPRSYGSGNPGATNVLRSGNKAAALLTLLGDAAKGWLAVWLAQRYGPALGLGEGTVALVAVAVFMGHLYPVFLRFKGGKGVATAAGVLLSLQPWLGLAVALVWALVAGFFRYSSLAAIVACGFAPLFYALVWGLDGVFVAVAVISGFTVWRHRANIEKLMAGKESRIGDKGGAARRRR
ncbi:MAG TPA: glycerol-3-phosphate 1-O-acyltransferase PlsY [Burkholderiaceae bacterium]|jgi:glycerol-3-phosphate acyltransferase PlsY|nr:glycerol-3-phosphate 1-O-acyltransferase PlsY [Burkholderiaceae bacterium]